MAIFGVINYGLYMILEKIIKYTTFNVISNLLPFYVISYYPFIIIHEITWAFSSVIDGLFYPILCIFYPISYNTPYYIVLSIFYWIFLIISPIIIFKVINDNNSFSINIKNHISVEYFAIMVLVGGCILISLIPSYIYGYISIMPSNLFDLKYLFFEYIKDFYVFYFLIVIGRIFRNYFKNITYN
ncbi:hypothetical protein Metok_0440 [Methanothermococcus okinawensis IH1]|uniref:Uncharacterized protein n=1 Tax=Methanothermococcus okinawensis (strain DSM 14208 / JCM 11175 / IH1) TaxID=647113 RepID=F8AKT0_METOI|nr:hypothetical protein Metok_0440 [Methanothermococcus okinawensis IH1]